MYNVRRILPSLLVVVVLAFTAKTSATEISAIRFNQTQQLARLVIDSDNSLIIDEQWSPEGLTLNISDISKIIKNSMIAKQVFGLGVTISKQDQGYSLFIPIQRTSLRRRFELKASANTPFRTVVDWSLGKVVTNKPINTDISPSTDDASLKQQAQDALTQGKYKKAITLLTNILEQGEEADKPFAIEFIGVARENNYQLAFAKQYYQRFLANYPESEQAPRVQQRLKALIGIQNITQKKVLKAGKRKNKRRASYTRGSLSFDYRKGQLINDLGESRDTISLASTDFDLRGHYQYKTSELDIRFSGGHYADLLDNGDATSDRLRYANIGWSSSDKQYSVDVGRQRSSGKGIFGRFDGAIFGYGVTDNQKVNVTLGYPVASSRVLSLDSERSFVSISYDWDDIFENIDMSMFVLNQQIGDLTDRQAVGGEFKFYEKQTSIYGLFDYDIFFNELNALLISGSYTTEEKTRYHWSFNKRKSPYISTRNALVGQASDSLEELQDLFITDEEILDLALDRTLESSSASFIVSQPINEDMNISANITWLDLSGAPESGGVGEIIDTDGQVYLNLYLGAKNLYSESDNNQLGLRLSNLATSDVWSIFGNSQYRINKAWRIRGKLRFDDRSNDSGTVQQSLSPGLRIQYQDKNNYFYTELGAIYYTHQTTGLPELKTDIYYLYLGYRLFF